MKFEISAKLTYPDPMIPAGLEFELPEDATVTLEIFTTSGTSVQRIFHELPMKAGTKLLDFHTLGLNRGEYSLRIIASVRGVEQRLTKNIYIERGSEGYFNICK